jgi:hypothetical protein
VTWKVTFRLVEPDKCPTLEPFLVSDKPSAHYVFFWKLRIASQHALSRAKNVWISDTSIVFISDWKSDDRTLSRLEEVFKECNL